MLNQAVKFQDEIILSKDTIGSISLFGAVNQDQLAVLLKFMCIRNCHAGERIFSAGDLPSEIYIVLHGRVDFVTENKGVHNIQSSYKLGDLLGETAVIGIQKQMGTAIAYGEKTQLLVLTRDALISIQREHTELYGILMMNIARDLSRKLHAR